MLHQQNVKFYLTNQQLKASIYSDLGKLNRVYYYPEWEVFKNIQNSAIIFNLWYSNLSIWVETF